MTKEDPPAGVRRRGQRRDRARCSQRTADTADAPRAADLRFPTPAACEARGEKSARQRKNARVLEKRREELPGSRRYGVRSPPRPGGGVNEWGANSFSLRLQSQFSLSLSRASRRLEMRLRLRLLTALRCQVWEQATGRRTAHYRVGTLRRCGPFAPSLIHSPRRCTHGRDDVETR